MQIFVIQILLTIFANKKITSGTWNFLIKHIESSTSIASVPPAYAEK